ncbi:hypothetical protein PATA110616_16265 [Paenibacillus tarimensis]
MNGLLRQLRVCRVERHSQPLFLLLRHQLDRMHSHIRTCRNLFSYILQMSCQLLHQLLVVDLPVEAEFHLQMFIRNDRHIEVIAGLLHHLNILDYELLFSACSLNGFHIKRVVLKDQQMVDQPLLHIRQRLNLRQRAVFICARLRIHSPQPVQQITEPVAFLRADPHRNGINEQSRHMLDAFYLRRAPRYDRAEYYISAGAVTLQHNGPCSLKYGIQGGIMAPCRLLHPPGQLCGQQQLQLARFIRRRSCGAARESCPSLIACKITAPEAVRFLPVSAIKPFHIAPVRSSRFKVGFVSVPVQRKQLLKQRGGTPAVHYNVMVGP